MLGYREGDTIAACATPAGRGGLAVIRVSGPDAEALLGQVFVPKGGGGALSERVMTYGTAVRDGRALDECMAVLMRAPRSYTREDVAELQLHGGEQVVRQVLDALFALGARPAEPGEFTRRAFLNGRIDLSQAEAVMGLVSASGSQAAGAALRQLQGGALRFVQDAQADLLRALSGVSAALDFPDEVDEGEALVGIIESCEALAKRLADACDERGSRILEEGLRVVIAGRPNAGKSSLLNALLMEERAIVTPIPGTTRDVVTGSVELGGVRVHLADTAGIREGAGEVEEIGIARAKAALRGADLGLLAVDLSRPLSEEDRAIRDSIGGAPHIVVLCKADLPEYPDGKGEWAAESETVLVSAKTGEGLDTLRAAIARHAGNPAENALTLARHLRLAREASAALSRGALAMRRGDPLEACAVELHAALARLGEITGENVGEALLDEVFGSFCVGK
ncbi:MAG TPA: tRNA uridine-5-carboxymethylaminomethyl(34) synthesis GTPase MnmE [Candidatus Limnocylindria bacterium]|nr:tRNA uridine-5-carboxymethylaminomethyl(34) synthesis GTPase MnmE [Candidatus Limnocylindria bacterium]